MASNEWPKICACGAKWSADSWRERPFVGLMSLTDDEAPLELRQCVCGSTIAVPVDASDDDPRAR